MKRNCNQCQQLITTNKRKNAKFCSLLCYSENRIQENLKLRNSNCFCSSCSKPLWKEPSKLERSAKKHNGKFIVFCDRYCRYQAQKLGGVSELHPPHYGTAKIDYRQLAFSAYDKACVVCGYDENELGLDVHHKDGNHLNNDILNLEILCCIHHAIHHRSRGSQKI